MIPALRAELFKAIKHARMTVFTVGALPIIAFTMLNFIAIFARSGFLIYEIQPVNWQEQVILALLFANNFLAQGLFIILGAFLFGSESNWNTWKNVIPRNRRINIVLSKIIVIGIGISVAIHSMAVLTYIGAWEVALFTESRFISGAFGGTEIPFWTQYLMVSFILFSFFFIGALYATIVAIQTESMSAGIVVALVLNFVDILSQPAFNLLSRLLRWDIFDKIPPYLPNYQLQNLASWLSTGTTAYEWSILTSSTILLLWMLTLVTLAVYLFLGRDIS